ncbi:MAG: ABC transporter permease [Saccharofermentanales bacterium]
MYILKNAFKSISRSKGRNILISIIIIIIAISSCIALSIKNSAAQIVQSYKDSFALTATIGIDREALRELAQTGGTDIREIMSGIQSPGIDDIKKYGTSSYLKGYTYTLTSALNSSTIIPLTNDETLAVTAGADQNGKTVTQTDNNGRTGGMFQRGDFSIIGYSGLSAMSDFVSGTYKITSGTMFADTDKSAVCVISKELATENELKVGDSITFTNPSVETETYKFVITGLYEDTTADDSSSMNWFSNAANQVITNYTALANMISLSQAASDKAVAAAEKNDVSTDATALNSQLMSTFYLKDTESVAGFTAELKTKGLDDKYTVTTNSAAFDESVKPLTNLDSFATIFLILVLIIGGIILAVLNMINIRERKYEVGVLRAIGMKKGKLALQFAAELLIVTFISITIGSAVGAFASVPTASFMLKNEITSIQEDDNQIAQNFGRPGGGDMALGPAGGRAQRNIMGGMFNPSQKVNYITQINAVINLKVLLQLFLIGILLTMVSSIISIILISRYEPLKILSNRS